MNNPEVSIIVPVYNAERFIARCINSVLAQTFINFELILVNDGSNDASDDICLEYAMSDDRIIYIHQENAGVSGARNKGIDLANGKYICFVDADDYIEADYVEIMRDAAEKSEADIVIQGLKQIKDGKVVKIEQFDKGIYPVSALHGNLFDEIFYYCGPYCKLFNSSIIKSHNLRFPLGMSYGEDAVFYHAYLQKCKVVELIDSARYNYMIANQGALSTKALPPDKFWQNQSSRRGAYRRLKSVFGLPSELSNIEQQNKLISIGGMMSSIFKSNSSDSQVRDYLEMMIKDVNFGLVEMNPTGVFHKFIFYLIKINTKLSRWILKIAYQ